VSDTLAIIPSYIAKSDHARALNNCVKSLKDTSECEIIIVDDKSPFDEQSYMIYDHFNREYENIEIVYQKENRGFSSSVNVGLQKALDESRDAVLINADMVFLDNNWLQNLENSDAHIVGGKLLYPNELIQHGGIYFSVFTRNFDHRFKCAPADLPEANEPCECPVTGALQFIKHEVLNDVGLYDEDFKLGYEDVDFMIRSIGKGYKSLYNPTVIAYHHESLIRGFNASEEHIKWQKESYLTLLKKHSDKNFFEVAPTMMEKYIEFT
jgi:GT2 family glycosyltransferase